MSKKYSYFLKQQGSSFLDILLGLFIFYIGILSLLKLQAEMSENLMQPKFNISNILKNCNDSPQL